MDSSECQCGEVESVSHYLLFCPLYEKEREQMRRNLFQNCGIINLDMNKLLDTRKEDELKEWRDIILTELETYVAGTKWFAPRNTYYLCTTQYHDIIRKMSNTKKRKYRVPL